jgi:AraC-like DNA-binding protein
MSREVLHRLAAKPLKIPFRAEVWYKLTNTLLSTINRSASVAEIEAVQRFLNGLDDLNAFDYPFIQAVFEQIYSSGGEVRVQALANLSGLSLRQFERRFKRVVGLSPKRVTRFVRFEAVRNRLLQVGLPHPNALAHEFGYTDESHFIRDFKSLAACTPNDFIQMALQRMTGFYKTSDPRPRYPFSI